MIRHRGLARSAQQGLADSMRILIVSGYAHIPQRSGGIESSTHDLALALQQRGHQVSVLCGLMPGGGLASLLIRLQRKLSLRSFPADRWLGYPVYRQWEVEGSIATAVKEFAPDVAIVQMGHCEPLKLVRELGACGVPVLAYLRDVEVKGLGGDPRSLPDVQFIANSQFTARRYKALFGIDCIVIPPLIHAERYAAPRRPANVTFINPYADKGKEIALQIAQRCPDIPFCFVESWTLIPSELKDLQNRLATLPNITLRRRTRDMKEIYCRAKIVLAPSVWEEAWGRVVTEAHVSGIPVVASNLGGLPESVGPGGALLDPTGPIEPWVEAVRRLWSDAAFYGEMSAAARAYSQRPEIDPTKQIDALLAAAFRAQSGSAMGTQTADRRAVIS